MRDEPQTGPGTRVVGIPGIALFALAAWLASAPMGTVAHAGEEPVSGSPVDMGGLVRRFAADENSLRRFHPERLSRARSARLRKFHSSWQARLDAVDFERLDVDGRVDWILLCNHLQEREDELRLLDERWDETHGLIPFAQSLIALEASRRLLEAVDPAACAERLHLLEQAVARTRNAARGDGLTPKPAPVLAYRVAGHLGRLRGMLKTWFTYRDGYEPTFGWWVRKPYRALDAALAGYEKYLREDVAGVKRGGAAPLIGDPIGRDALQAALAREFVPYTPEELIALAETELAWCEREGAQAGVALGVEGGWPATVEAVKAMHRPPGTQDDLVAGQAREAIAFVERHDLVGVPALCRETWRLEMISTHGQKTMPFAVYNNQAMLVAYATEDMEHDAKLMSMRGNNEHFTRIVTPHELIPGHHLQLFQADRYRTHRKLFRTAFLVEGWALHWEMLLWDRGWARNAADRVGMLFWRMHRCARILVTLRFHLGRMKPEEMIDFLVERVGHERDGATSEVRRYVAGSYGPLYQCAYMLGGLQMRALHAELVGGGQMTDRAFHDAVLEQNSIPIELIRAALQGTKLSRAHGPSWRFRGDPLPAAKAPSDGPK